MKEKIKFVLERMDIHQSMINKTTSNVSPNTNQTGKTKLGTTPVLTRNIHTNEPLNQPQQKPIIKETESVTPANAMGASSPSNASGPIAMPEKLLKKPLKRILKRK